MPEAKAKANPLNTLSSKLLILYAIAIPLSPQFQVGGFKDLRPTDIILVVLVLTFVVDSARNRAGWREPALLQPLFWVLLWSAARMMVAPDYEFGSHAQVLGVYYFCKRLEYVVMFVVAYLICIQPGRLQIAVRALLVGAIGFHLLVLWEFHAHEGIHGFRSSGFGGDQPNQAALFIVGVCALAAIWMQRMSERDWRWVSLGVIVTGVAALLATGSKEGLICAMLTGFLLAVWRQRWSLVMGSVAIMLLIIPLFPDSMKDRYVEMVDEGQRTFDAVTLDPSLMPSAGSSSLANRVINAQWVFDEVLPDCLWTGKALGSVHLGSIDDFYLFEWVNNGLIGLLLFFGFLYAVWKLLMQCLRSKDELSCLIGQALTCYFVALLVDGLAAEVFYVVRPMELFFLCLGLLSGRQAYVSMTAADRQRLEAPGLASKLRTAAAFQPLPAPAARRPRSFR
ncbi:MAG TPA: hypothetical protein VGO93_17490 [Candidatus Xenobia bacterium]|jgi:hypothetical protein